MDPASSEAASRTHASLGDIAVALASGCAAVLSFMTSVSATLIGVVVAVTLSPSLVTFGLLLGDGHAELAIRALSLFLVNLICVTPAGAATFLAQGIQPTSWREKGRATRVAMAFR